MLRVAAELLIGIKIVSLYRELVMKIDNYIFLCSSNGDMHLQNIKKETLISAKNQVSEDAPSTILFVGFYSSTDC